MTIRPESQIFDQRSMRRLFEHNDPVQRYRALFARLDWRLVPEPWPDPSPPGKRPHPQSASIKAWLIQLTEGYASCTDLRRFLLQHPLLVLEIGLRPVLKVALPSGFDVERSVPTAGWFSQHQRRLDHRVLQDLFAATVPALLEEIPGRGQTVACDVKHIDAWGRANHPREHIKDRFCKQRQPKGDRDCKVGVKTSTTKEQPDGSRHRGQGRPVGLWLRHRCCHHCRRWRGRVGPTEPALQPDRCQPLSASRHPDGGPPVLLSAHHHR